MNNQPHAEITIKESTYADYKNSRPYRFSRDSLQFDDPDIPLPTEEQETPMKVKHLNHREQITPGLTRLISLQLHSYGVEKTGGAIRDTLHRILSDDHARLSILYDSDGKELGFAFGNIALGLESGGKYFWLNELFIIQEERTKGLGRLLLNSIMDWAKQQGCRYLYGVTGMKNSRALSFYQAMEFDISPTRWLGKKL